VKYDKSMKAVVHNGKTYPVTIVKDHLTHIVEAITTSTILYTRSIPTALDFSNLRKRGAKTSSTGESTGAASFAEMLDNTVTPLSIEDSSIKPLAILKDTHPDIEEFRKTTPVKTVIKIVRSEDWSILEVVETSVEVEKPVAEEKKEKWTPFWKLSKEDQIKWSEIREKRSRFP